MMRRLSQSTAKNPHVCIVGAGIAGLRCADVLIKSGVKVTMYEARNRIGGRAHQIESAGRFMDMGPNWIHGTRGNPISDISKRTGTVIHKWDESQVIFDSDGHPMSDEKATEISEVVWETIVKAFHYSNNHSDGIEPSESLMDFFERTLPKEQKDPQRVSELLKFAEMWGAYVGDPIQRQSLKFFYLEELIDGENVFVASTYKDIVKDIASTALESAEINFNTEVNKFESNLDAQSKPQGVTIRNSTGLEKTYDEVVVTTPFGWLKKHHTEAFQPPLPERLCQAISNISYGRLEKVYVTFPSAFWRTRDYSPSFIDFMSPNYISHPAEIAWNQQIVSLAELPGQTAKPTLLFYLYGPCGTHMVELIAGLDPSSSPYHNALASFFEPFYSRIPGYSSEIRDCKPVAFLATQWQHDPYAGHGSYTNYQIGLQHADKDIETMRHGLGDERAIWFAGEHTAPLAALGTTTGAYWAGEGVARRICALYDIKVPAAAAPAPVSPNNDDEVEATSTKDLNPRQHDAANLNGIAL